MMPLELAGFTFITSLAMVEKKPYPRSPARARRRAKKGYPQHMVYVPRNDFLISGNTIFVHPATLPKIRQALYQATRRELGLSVR